MKCTACGYENAEGKDVCPVCNSVINENVLAEEIEDMFVVEAKELPKKGALANMFNDLASSLTLKLAVIFQIICIVFDVLLFSHIFGNIKRFMIATDALNLHSEKLYNLISEAAVWILVFPMVLSVAGILTCIISSATKKRVSIVGVKLFNVSKYIEMLMVIGGIMLLVVAQMGEGGKTVVTAIVVFMNALFLVFAIFYYIGMMSSVRRIMYSMANDEPTESLSGSLIVCSVAFAIFCLAVSALGFFDVKNIVLGLWGFPFAISQILYALFVKKYNRAMEWLYVDSWNEQY